jgi:hypothetical protein
LNWIHAFDNGHIAPSDLFGDKSQVQTTRTSPVACEPAGVTLETFEARFAEKTMLEHTPKMAEIANAAVLAASDHASSITAAVLNCNCGEIAD